MVSNCYGDGGRIWVDVKLKLVILVFRSGIAQAFQLEYV